MMFTTYWEMQFNPFSKQASGGHPFESEDFRQMSARLKNLCEIKCMGLFTGAAGVGKTFAIKKFADSLNPSMYKAVYLPLSSLTVMEFYRALAMGLGLAPQYKKIDLFNSIQERILSLSKDKRVTAVIIIDESQYLGPKIFNDLKIIMNFNMDSENHAAVAISGQPALAGTLSMGIHDALAQRILVNYAFCGLSKGELPEYINSRLTACGVRERIFADNAIEALWGCCAGSPRLVNTLAENSLIIGFQKGAKNIDAETVMAAHNEMSLV